MTQATSMKDTAQRAANKLQTNAQDAGHSLREIAEDAGHTVREFLNEQSEKASHMRKQTEETITKHPLQAVAIAAVAGLVLGALLRR